MNTNRRFLAILVLITITFPITTFASSEKNTASHKIETTAAKGELKIMRKDDTVSLSWTLPPGAWTVMDVMRNTNEKPKGRTKVKTMRATIFNYTDKIPDAGGQYWYWIKVVDKDKKAINIGPVQAK